ncbi:MAG: Mur ligase family protein [Planctomycetota bacterium]|nr:Mur ligase family protein [Planctomycetota bacterium]
MDYAETLTYLDTFVNLERQVPTHLTPLTITLDRVRELAARLGNPHDRFASLHVAGTKGKGSTCAFAAAILAATGLKTGLYTSPHLQDIRERITINGRLISQAEFAGLLEPCVPALEAMRHPPLGQRRPTYFEVLTHLAFSWFAAEQVDVAVVEVGLGGRLDATNIITPLACGITNISFDHQVMLGNTLALIAREKAGIMKKGVPVVIAPQAAAAAQALEERAREVGAPCELVGRDIRCAAAAPVARRPDACAAEDAWPLPQAHLELPGGTAFDAELGLRGGHQVENWAVAVRLADLCCLKRNGAHVAAHAVREGSRTVRWPGRLEKAGPRLFLDGAHNDHSLRTVLREMLPHVGTPLVLFACAKDKDAAAMLKVLAEAGVSRIVFTHSGSSRSMDPQELARLWKEQTGRDAPAYVSCAEALAAARGAAGEDTALLVAGSLYLVGAVKDILDPRA